MTSPNDTIIQFAHLLRCVYRSLSDQRQLGTLADAMGTSREEVVSVFARANELSIAHDPDPVPRWYEGLPICDVECPLFSEETSTKMCGVKFTGTHCVPVLKKMRAEYDRVVGDKKESKPQEGPILREGDRVKATVQIRRMNVVIPKGCLGDIQSVEDGTVTVLWDPDWNQDAEACIGSTTRIFPQHLELVGSKELDVLCEGDEVVALYDICDAKRVIAVPCGHVGIVTKAHNDGTEADILWSLPGKEVDWRACQDEVRVVQEKFQVKNLKRGDVVQALKPLDPKGAGVVIGQIGVVFEEHNAYKDGNGPMVRWDCGAACNVSQGDVELQDLGGKG